MSKSHPNLKEKNTEDTMKNLKSLSTLILLACTAAYGQLTPSDGANKHKPTIVEFEAPGAGTGAYEGTVPNDINSEGAITGLYFDENDVGHGFLLADGTFTTIDAPGAGTGPGQGTNAESINSAGVITGLLVDSNDLRHGYVRFPDGTFQTFQAPGAGAGANQGTLAYNINQKGEIAGEYVDASNVYHGFVLLGRTFTTFDAP